MNPELVKALRQLLAAERKMPDLSEEEKEAFVREETKGRHGLADARALLSEIDNGVSLRDMGRSFVQGVGANFADEGVGLIQGDDAKEEFRLRDDRFKEQHPFASGAANVAGGIASGIATAGLGAPMQVGGRVASAAATAARGGAIFGAAAGAGEGESLRGRATGAAMGGGIGGLLGGVLGGAVGGIANRFGTTPRAERAVTGAVRRAGGTAKVVDRLADANRAGVGKEVVAADLSPHLQQGLDFAVNNNPDTYVKAVELLNPRQANMTSRLLKGARRAIGNANAPARAKELRNQTRAMADEAFGALRDADAAVPPEAIAKHLSKPTIPQAFKYARLAGDIGEGDPVDTLVRQLLAQNPKADASMLESAVRDGVKGGTFETPSRPITFNDMQTLKRVLDSRIKTAFSKGDGELGEAYKTMRDSIRETMVDVWPGYKVADSMYAARMRLERSLKNGVLAMKNDDSRQLRADIAEMTAEELDEFRTGMASRLFTDLRKTAKNHNAAARILDAGDAVQDKLMVIFGDKPTFDRFMKLADWERTMAGTKNVTGGSQTHRRGAAADYYGQASLAPPAQSMTPGGLVRTAINKTVGPLIQRSNARVASKVGKKLLTQGSPAIEKMLMQLESPTGQLLNRGLLGAMGGGSGLLSSR